MIFFCRIIVLTYGKFDSLNCSFIKKYTVFSQKILDISKIRNILDSCFIV